MEWYYVLIVITCVVMFGAGIYRLSGEYIKRTGEDIAKAKALTKAGIVREKNRNLEFLENIDSSDTIEYELVAIPQTNYGTFIVPADAIPLRLTLATGGGWDIHVLKPVKTDKRREELEDEQRKHRFGGRFE